MKIAIPRLYLGSMTFAWGSQTSSVVDESVASEMMRRFVQANQDLDVKDHRLDTARVYAGGNTEPMVGEVLKRCDAGKAVLVGTKAHPSVQPGGLSPDGMRQQFQDSITAMNVPSVEEYYLHQPDTEHPLLDSLRCAHALVQDGKVNVVGMSNYHVSEMARAFALCKEHNLTPPTVYQGLYNPLNRLVEAELLPLLKANNCAFVAYNPLAAGLLTGKHKSRDDVAKGRFQNNPNYLPRFYTDSNFQALALIREACDHNEISMIEATYRWLLRHSKLTPSDGLLLGASSLEQLDQNLASCKAAASQDDGGLPDDVLEAFEKAWSITEASSFPYWRSYSSDMPGRESLDQGASYNAAKTK
uniref:NADP-dependent oxidoreductase domain-containing protein n=1 Tax=Craspedostauros australis TaxID=1486917 RepID=A0A7R9WMD0_9STRA|eukprot:CAMPEP_0198123724 /NCGR_PEP_ID=MMETSP1442-20131203/38196_1 /TAXON_ID= /ORGANISM="Craspedostauros australis, Strain CCMP3328" /LENGTH=357 /DNA_ID=CAMNT_0043782977 /DNA_START=109 /DNA_END=1182 /DNA_ORIENTATION=-